MPNWTYKSGAFASIQRRSSRSAASYRVSYIIGCMILLVRYYLGYAF
jgi:hypothetical protein